MRQVKKFLFLLKTNANFLSRVQTLGKVRIGPKDFHWDRMFHHDGYVVNMRHALEESHEKEVSLHDSHVGYYFSRKMGMNE